MLSRGIALTCALLAAAVTGCGDHDSMRGTVVMKVDSTTAHVCLGDGEVAVNDQVRLYTQVCTQIGRGSVCKKAVIGDGIVTELIDEHYSVVALPPGTNFEEGNAVEKL